MPAVRRVVARVCDIPPGGEELQTRVSVREGREPVPAPMWAAERWGAPESNVPCVPKPFVERAELFRRLGDALSGERVVVLAGDGAVGKSALAAHWARRNAAEFSVVWWITADSAAAVDAGIADLARAAGGSAVSGQDPEVLRRLGLAWLASHTGWLVVLDGVVVRGDAEALFGRAGRGRFLITGRVLEGWDTAGSVVPVDQLDRADVVDLFATVAGTDVTAAGEICRQLEYEVLPVRLAAGGAARARLESGSPTAWEEFSSALPERAASGAVAEGESGPVARAVRATSALLSRSPWRRT